MLGVASTGYYRPLRAEALANDQRRSPVRPVQAYEALPAENTAVREYALKYLGIRHRVLALMDVGVNHFFPTGIAH